MKRWVPGRVLSGAPRSQWGSRSPTRVARGLPLAVIGGAIAAGELIELRPPLARGAADLVRVHGRAGAATGDGAGRGLVLVVAELATFLVRSEPTSVEGRLALFGERMLEGMASRARVPRHDRALGGLRRRWQAVRAGDAAVAPIVIAEVARMVRERQIRSPHTDAWPTSRSSPARR